MQLNHSWDPPKPDRGTLPEAINILLQPDPICIPGTYLGAAIPRDLRGEIAQYATRSGSTDLTFTPWERDFLHKYLRNNNRGSFARKQLGRDFGIHYPKGQPCSGAFKLIGDDRAVIFTDNRVYMVGRNIDTQMRYVHARSHDYAGTHFSGNTRFRGDPIETIWARGDLIVEDRGIQRPYNNFLGCLPCGLQMYSRTNLLPDGFVLVCPESGRECTYTQRRDWSTGIYNDFGERMYFRPLQPEERSENPKIAADRYWDIREYSSYHRLTSVLPHVGGST